MKKRKTIYVAVIAALMGIGFFLGGRFFFKDPYARMFVTFGPGNMPCIEVNIQGQTHSVLVNLAATIPLTLNKDVLTTIKTKSHGSIQIMNEKGEKFEYRTFIIPEINIGDLKFTDVIVAETDEAWEDNHRVGEIGRPLLKKKNLLLDFHNSTIITCNSIDKLRRIGYRLEDMTRVPFEMEEQAGGVTLSALSDFGTIKLALCTGAAVSLIRSSFVKENETEKDALGGHFTSSNLTIGGRNWGRQRLYLQDLAMELQEFDGAIGMDFLSDHIVYIDFKNNVLFLKKEFQ